MTQPPIQNIPNAVPGQPPPVTTLPGYPGDTVPASPLGNATLSGATLVRYIYSRATRLGLDPAAVLAVAQQEGGFWGNVGDQGTSFGPFQMHGGATKSDPISRGQLPQSVWAQGPDYARAWANSQAGIDYALAGIHRDVGNARGIGAISAQVNSFENPAKQLAPGEIQRAAEAYSGIQAALRTLDFTKVSGASAPASAGSEIGGILKGGLTGGLGSLPTVGPVIGGIGQAGHDVTGIVTAPITAAEATVHGFSWFFDNWDRVLEVAAGFILLLVGAILMGRHMLGKSTDIGALASGQVASRANEKGYSEGFETGRVFEQEKAGRKEQAAADRQSVRDLRQGTAPAYDAGDDIGF